MRQWAMVDRLDSILRPCENCLRFAHPAKADWRLVVDNRHIDISEVSDSGIPEARNIGTAWSEIAMEWNRMDWNGTARNGMEWCGMEMK